MKAGFRQRCRAAGIVIAPPGVIVRHTFEAAGSFRERCRLAGVAERRARDSVITARYTASGRRRAESSPIVRQARAAYRKARRALQVLQSECPHATRSMHSPIHCDVCFAEVGVLS